MGEGGGFKCRVREIRKEEKGGGKGGGHKGCLGGLKGGNDLNNIFEGKVRQGYAIRRGRDHRNLNKFSNF